MSQDLPIGPRRPTQKDIARAAGVHNATVSLALKNHPSIPEATRQRLRKIADRLGYVPDPMLSALAAYRGRNRPARAFQGTLAWLVNRAGSYAWSDAVHVRRYHEGACARARSQGFAVETFDLGTGGMTARRLAAVFRARNVRGLLLCPQPQPQATLEFPWDGFSPVTFAHSLAKPALHAVGPAHYLAMLETMRRVHRRGYRRPGLVLSAVHDLRIEHHFLAGYLAERESRGGPAIPPLFWDRESDSPRALASWIKLHTPDAVVTGDYRILESLKKAGLRVPRDLGAACAGLPDGDEKSGDLAGIVEQSFHVGEVAVDFLTGLLHRGEYGVPRLVQRVHVEGVWREGKSLTGRG